MIRALKIIFLMLFVFNVLPHGGVSVRYPVLERLLERLDQEQPKAVAQEIRHRTDPSDMCGVKAVLESNQRDFFGFNSLSRSLSQAPMVPIDVVRVMPVNKVVPVWLIDAHVSSPLPQAVFLPPPRLAA